MGSFWTREEVRQGRRAPWRCCRLRSCVLKTVAFLSILATLAELWTLRYVQSEQESPLDHVLPNLMKPFLACPPITNDCRPADAFPRMFMIHARRNGTDHVLSSWKKIATISQSLNDTTGVPPHLTVIDTFRMSKSYRNTKCKTLQWHHRLFHVYQQVFSDILTLHPNDTGFIFLEDDVLLVNSTAFQREVCFVVRSSYDFYSFYKTPSSQESCWYEYGTPAFYIRPKLMRNIISQVSKETFCRLPIDMYLSTLGPWYVTRTEMVRHIGTRVHLA